MAVNILTTTLASTHRLWGEDGSNPSAGSGDNAIDGSDSTYVTANTNANWNALYVFPTNYLVDSYRVKQEASLSYRVRVGTGTNGTDGELTDVAAGSATDSGIVQLPSPVSIREVQFKFTVTGQPKNVYTLELWSAEAPPTPSTPGDIANAMVAWLADNGDNTHRDGDTVPGLPDRTYQSALAIQGLAEGTSGFSALKADTAAVKTVTDRLDDLSNGALSWLNDRSSQLTDFLNGVNSGAVAALNNLASRITGSGAGGGSAFYGSGGLQVAQSAEDTLALVQLLAGLKRNALVDFPGTPWVQTDTTTFDTSLAWAVEADLYVVSFTDLGGGIVNLDAAGVDVSYRLAWWCPLIGAFGQQRRFIDFPDNHLWLDGQRMPGLLLHSPKGATGSVQAWTYD